MKLLKLIIVVLCVLYSFNSFSQKTNYDIKNLEINTKYSDFGVSFMDKNTAVFASSKPTGLIGKRVWKQNNQPYLNLFKGAINNDGEISNVTLFSRRISTKYHESDAVFTKDKKTVYFSRNNYFKHRYRKDSQGWNNIKMYKATILKNGDWGNIEELPFNNDEYSVGHPALSANESKLYFTSDMPGSIGKTDIWEVAVLEDGKYGTPINLGAVINSLGKEMFPSVEGNTLYFSSDTHDGMGDLDIFKSSFEENGMSIPVNLGSSINSTSDDFGFVVRNDAPLVTGYFSSNREGGKGDDDIYYFKQKKCLRFVTGIVKDLDTKQVISGSKVTLYDANKKVLNTKIVGGNGSFKFEVDCNIVYEVVAEHSGFVNANAVYSNFKIDSEYQILVLKKEEFSTNDDNIVINIDPIYFDFDKAVIRADAIIELNKVVRIMKKYPSLRILAGSHTDARGNDSYNSKLACRRAKSTVDFIVSRGIDSNRLTANGYGESQLQNHCSNGVKCSEYEHQLNRRTEFVIVNPEEIK